MAVSFSVENRTVLLWLTFLSDYMLLMVCWWLALWLHSLHRKKKWVKLGSWESPNVTPKLQFTVPIIRSNYFCVVSAWEHGLSSCQEAAVLEALFCCVGGREILVNNSFHLQETHNSLEESSTTTLGSVRLRIGVLFLFWWIMLNHFALNTYISLWHRNLRGSLITGS